MAKAKITYDYNDKTGRRVIHVDLESDPDSLAYEHENLHRRVVNDLLGKGLISPEEAGDVQIERPQHKPAAHDQSDRDRIPPKPKAQGH